MKHKHWKEALSALMILLCLCCNTFMVFAADADGSELQVLQPERLEIQLGTEWAGVEFQLKTDAGLYPGTIPVGADGVLRLEIGGSSSYILSCLGSSVAIPKPGEVDDIAPTAEENQTDSDLVMEDAENPNQIPTMHLVLFGGGLVLAASVLIAMLVADRKHAVDVDYEEDDGE